MAPDIDDAPPSSRAADFLAEMEELRNQGGPAAELGIPDVLTCGPPHDWDTEYVPAGTATWRHLTGAVAEAERKGRDGESVTKALRAAVERLRPQMESDPNCTIEEALRRESAPHKAPG